MALRGPRKGTVWIALLIAANLALGYKAWSYRQQRGLLGRALEDVLARPALPEGYDDLVRTATLGAMRQPLADDREIPAVEDRAYLERVLAEVFPGGHRQLSDEEKCLGILRFVACHHRRADNSGSATKILREGRAICGGIAHVFKILVRQAGVPARYLGLFSVPNIGSHAVCEAWFEGKWHFFDPTHGTFFYSRSRYGGGEILALEELLIGPASGTMMKAVERPWTGVFDQAARDFPVTVVAHDYLLDYYHQSLLGLYRDGLRAAFPVVLGEKSLVSFPLVADLRSRDRLQIGANDGAPTDVSRVTREQKGAGMHYIGRSTPDAVHTLLLKARKGEILEIEYTGLRDEELVLLPLAYLRCLERYQEANNRTVFRVLPIAEESVAMIVCPNGSLTLDAIQIRRVDSSRVAAFGGNEPWHVAAD